jgi:hypothetical protein
MDIMQMVTGSVTPLVASRIASAFGVPEAAVRKLMTMGVPVVLASLLKRGATAGGTDAIGAALKSLGGNPLDALGRASGGGEPADVTAAAQSGSDLLGSLFGVGTASGMTKTLASFAGVDEKAAAPLMGLVGSTALGSLKATAVDQGLDTAGVMKLLESQKAQINAAIPADVSRQLSAAGILPHAAAAVSQARAAVPEVPAVSGMAGWMKWAIGAAAVLALLWLASMFFGGGTAPVTTETAAPAPAAPAAADPLVVEGVNIGERVQGILTGLSDTLAGVTDAETATAAAAKLTEADTALGGLQSAVGALSGEGKTALAALVNGALPALRTTIDGLLANTAIAPIVKPALDGILAKLTAFAA